jgi:hypothetical protein
MCVVPEAGGTVCPLWYEATTAKMPVTHRSVFVLLDVGHSSASDNICGEFFSSHCFFLLSRREREKRFD